MIDKIIAERYRVFRRLGSGGMAQVFLAQDLKTSKEVAIKIMAPRGEVSAMMVKRFKREFDSCRSLDHKNIVKLYERGRVGKDAWFYSMEYLSCGDLVVLLNENGPFNERIIIGFLEQMLSAFEHFHSRSIVHRDLKPANIMVDGKRYVITDFGLAFADGCTKLTDTGTVLGTPLYMSPEMARGEKVDNRSDLFQLGVITYELLAGEVPITGKSVQEVFQKIVSFRPPPIHMVVPELNENWSVLLSKMMEKDRNNRYQSAKDVLADLRLIKAGKSISKLPPKETIELSSQPKQRVFNWRPIVTISFCVVLCAFLLWSHVGKEDLNDEPSVKRPIHSTKAEQLSVKAFDLTSDSLRIELNDGSTVNMPLSDFSTTTKDILITPTLSLRKKLSSEVRSINRVLGAFDPKSVLQGVEEIVVPDTAHISKIVEKGEEDEEARIISELKKGNQLRSFLEERLLRTTGYHRFKRAMVLAPLILGTEVVSFSDRTKFFEVIQRFRAIYFFSAFFHGALPFTAEPELGAWRLSKQPLEGVAQEFVLYKKVKKSLTLGMNIPIANIGGQRRWSTNFTVPSTDKVTKAELAFFCKFYPGIAMTVKLNDLPEIIVPDVRVLEGMHLEFDKRKKKELERRVKLYQRIPREAIRKGNNTIVLRVSPLFSSMSRSLIKIGHLSIRLVEEGGR